MGKLYFCPTPIGNLADITLRTLKILEEVDLIAAEDTRVSLKLLNHYKIKKPLTSLHKFNEMERIPFLLKKVKEGQSVAIISDAGMPGISDPGEILVKKAIEEGVEFEVLPGANAALTALVASGLSTERFMFIGFLKGRAKERRELLESTKNLKATLIFYEAPHRVKATLEEIAKYLGNRKVVLCRELTKMYEEIVRDNINNILENMDNLTIKGEFVILVEEAFEVQREEVNIKALLKELIEEGYSKSAAVKEVVKKSGIAKNLVYEESLKL